jgi:multidrug efflux pump subunit AcrA (membrane-fusion protein)
LTAVSGVERIDRGSEQVRSLERLAEAIARGGEALHYRGDSSHLAPQVQQVLQEYLDHSATRLLFVLPLPSATSPPAVDRPEPDKPCAALIVENLTAAEPEDVDRRVAAVASHAAIVLGRASVLDRTPLVRRLLRMQPLWNRWPALPAWAIALLVVSLILAGLFWIPGDFFVRVRGELRPRNEVRLFAPGHGIIEHVRVDHGDEVEQGAVLLELRSPDLDLEMKRVAGEIQTATKQLAALDAERLRVARIDSATGQLSSQLAADELAVRERLQNLREQYAILQDELAAMRLVSPIRGTVLTWKPSQRLLARPVQQGQILLTVADLSGPWYLKLRVPERQVGHVLAARASLREDLPVTFVLATEPRKTYQGNLAETSLATQAGPSEPAAVEMAVSFPPGDVALRPGAAAVAKIRCGRRSLGYLWLHDLYEEVRRRLF